MNKKELEKSIVDWFMQQRLHHGHYVYDYQNGALLLDGTFNIDKLASVLYRNLSTNENCQIISKKQQGGF